MKDWPEVLLADETAAYLRMGVNKTRRLLAAGVIPCVRFGNEYRVKRSALDAWLEGQSGARIPTEPMTRAARRELGN